MRRRTWARGGVLAALAATQACAAAPRPGTVAIMLGKPELLTVEPDVEALEAQEPAVAEDPQIPMNEALVGTADIPEDYAAPEEPPAPVVEDLPAQPVAEDAWVGGYWWWSPPLARYGWVSGAWRHPPPGHTWKPGSWVAGSPVVPGSAASARGVYYRTPGYWARAATGSNANAAEAMYAPLSQPPPMPANETYGLAPGPDYTWTSGYYVPRGSSYAWVPGAWQRPPATSASNAARPGVELAWVPPKYVASGGRYYFQPGRWDFPVEHRGVGYRPDIHVAPGAHFTPVAAPVSVVSAYAAYVAAPHHLPPMARKPAPVVASDTTRVGGSVGGPATVEARVEAPQRGFYFAPVHQAQFPTRLLPSESAAARTDALHLPATRADGPSALTVETAFGAAKPGVPAPEGTAKAAPAPEEEPPKKGSRGRGGGRR